MKTRAGSILVTGLVLLFVLIGSPAFGAAKEKGVAKTEKREVKEKKKSEKAAIKSGEKVDLNSASQGELEALPGVGAATAKKIMANRPYSSLADLKRAGVSASTIAKIRDQVKV